MFKSSATYWYVYVCTTYDNACVVYVIHYSFLLNCSLYFHYAAEKHEVSGGLVKTEEYQVPNIKEDVVRAPNTGNMNTPEIHWHTSLQGQSPK